MVVFDAEFIEGFVKTKTSKKQCLLAEKYGFFREYLKFSDFGQNEKGQFWPIFITEFWQPWKKQILIRFDWKRSYLKQNLLKVLLKQKLAKTNAY